MIIRDAVDDLKSWYLRKQRKPLLIRGARQVGKTTLVRMFSEIEHIQLVEINCEKPWGFIPLVEKLDPGIVLQAIEFELNISINPKNSLIFFDEVQNTPSILKLLRYFYEDLPEYRIITTGSLLEFVLDEPQFSIPVGRLELMYLGPFSFEEFLRATGEQQALDVILNFQLGDDIDQHIHVKLTQLLRRYVAIGGMPEVMHAYVQNISMVELERIKNSIIDTFKLDFHKYKKNTKPQLLSILFDSLPTKIGRKLKYSNIDKSYRSNEIGKSLHQLCLAKIVSKVFNTGCNGVPLGAEKKDRFFKCFMLDIGLIHTQLKLNPFEISEVDELNYINNGALAEQLIAQQLVVQHQYFIEPELYYWAREKKAASAEVDFVITNFKRRIIPVEVKAGSTGSLRSLQIIVIEKSLHHAVRFNSMPPSIFQEKRNTVKGESRFTLYSLPHYISGQLLRIVNKID
ncbi:MAG: ATP-binding protein [Desulfobacula sp.]|uniref:ATP-binding protein n=1 Tax=Desulfobacula sp. TaxID=2593537 RepID=UPI0025B95FC9|nr:ATP-binding protein [Desulfobacula sp.]MCD4719687.1 ATP-binding protein [Desulfobacula sp.]